MVGTLPLAGTQPPYWGDVLAGRRYGVEPLIESEDRIFAFAAVDIVEGAILRGDGVVARTTIHEIAAHPLRESPGVEAIAAVAAPEHVATAVALHGSVVSWSGVYLVVTVREGGRPGPGERNRSSCRLPSPAIMSLPSKPLS